MNAEDSGVILLMEEIRLITWNVKIQLNTTTNLNWLAGFLPSTVWVTHLSNHIEIIADEVMEQQYMFVCHNVWLWLHLEFEGLSCR